MFHLVLEHANDLVPCRSSMWNFDPIRGARSSVDHFVECWVVKNIQRLVVYCVVNTVVQCEMNVKAYLVGLNEPLCCSFLKALVHVQ